MNALPKTAPSLVLIVDDEPEIRELMALAFQSYGFRTIEADGGRRAFDLFMAQHVDAVVSDVRMAGGNGLELLARIKALRPDVPVFLTSGFSDVTEAQAKAQGAAALLVKPFGHATLVDAVVRAITLRAK